MIATFCGHRKVTEYEKAENWLLNATEELILKGIDKFYLGGL